MKRPLFSEIDENNLKKYVYYDEKHCKKSNAFV